MYNILTVCACDINQGAFTQYASLGAQLFVIRSILASQYSVAQGGRYVFFSLTKEKRLYIRSSAVFYCQEFLCIKFFFSIAYH